VFGHRQGHAVPILPAFADWLAEQAARLLPMSATGEAVTCAASQWPSLLVYTRDGRLTTDNGPAEHAIRPLAVGRNNRLHVGGDGRLRPAAVLLSFAASVRRHGANPWAYLKHVPAGPAAGPAAEGRK